MDRGRSRIHDGAYIKVQCDKPAVRSDCQGLDRLAAKGAVL